MVQWDVSAVYTLVFAAVQSPREASQTNVRNPCMTGWGRHPIQGNSMAGLRRACKRGSWRTTLDSDLENTANRQPRWVLLMASLGIRSSQSRTRSCWLACPLRRSHAWHKSSKRGATSHTHGKLRVMEIAKRPEVLSCRLATSKLAANSRASIRLVVKNEHLNSRVCGVVHSIQTKRPLRPQTNNASSTSHLLTEAGLTREYRDYIYLMHLREQGAIHSSCAYQKDSIIVWPYGNATKFPVKLFFRGAQIRISLPCN